ISAEDADVRCSRTLVRRLADQPQLIDAASSLQVILGDTHVLSRDLDIGVVLESESDRLANGDRTLVGHVNSDAAEIGQNSLFGFEPGRDSRNVGPLLG